jgi:hypothetical protein
LLSLVACAVLGAFPGRASAAGITCSATIGFNPPIADNVTPSTGCELGSTNNDSLGSDPALYQVNQDGMFGFDDWLFAGKAPSGSEAEDADIGFSVVGNSISGTWSIADLWSTLPISHLMLVFKGGNHEPDTYVAYLIEVGATEGDYLTPFKHHSRDQATDISHISAYVRQGTSTIPEPSALALLGFGLTAAARRLRRQTGLTNL